MVSEELVKEIASQAKGSGKSFAEFIVEIFKDHFIEIYVGDSYEEISIEQVSRSYPAVFVGKVIAAYKECLIISSAYVNKKTNKPEMGNLVFISERAIRALNEVDGKGNLEDMLFRSKDTQLVKNLNK